MEHAPGFLRIVEETKKQVREVTIEDVKGQLDRGERFVLVDVREESEWAAGHLPQAIRLGKGVIERDIEETIPETASRIVLYCGGGFRSALAAESIQKMGYRNVLSMDGGFRAWQDAGYEVERD